MQDVEFYQLSYGVNRQLCLAGYARQPLLRLKKMIC